MKNCVESSLPSSWSMAQLGQVLPIYYGKGLTLANRARNGRIPVYGSSGIVGRHSECLTTTPTLILGRKGSVGEVHYSSGPCWPIDTTYYAVQTSCVCLKYYYYLLKWLNLSALDKSTAVPGLSRSDYNEVWAPIAPLPEQERIVAKIEELFSRLDSATTSLKKIQLQLKLYRQSVLRNAMEGRLTSTWREKHRGKIEPADKLLKRILAERKTKWEEQEMARMEARGKAPKDDSWKKKYREPGPPNVDGLPELPEGWVWVSLGQPFEVHVGATPRRNKRAYWKGDIPWVSSGEVSFCRINQTNEKITTAGLKSSSTKVHRPGTVLMGMIGEGKTRGQAAILDIHAAHNQNCAAIRVADTVCPPEYTYSFLVSEYERTRQLGSGNNQPALNKTRIQRMVMPFPPLAEQKQIVQQIEECFENLGNVKNALKHQLKRLETVRQSILKKAFKGELVRQNANDESAGILLERIRKERQEQLRLKKKAPRVT